MRFLIVVLFACAATVSADLLCTPGLRYKDECNICHCSSDGKKAACTDMLCPSAFGGNSKVRKAEQFCEPNERFQMSAVNDCTCTSDGQHAMCTLGFNLVKATTYSIDVEKKYCERGQVFSPDNCNICRCSKDGQFAMCTLKFCYNDEKIDFESGVVPAAPKQICEPGSQFKDFCNTCHCSNDGTEKACTKMFCDPEIWNADGSFKDEALNTAAKSTGVKRICQPKSIFKEYCNTCRCSADGTMKACTEMYCNPGLWNVDGSLKEVVKGVGRSAEPAKQICKPKTAFKDYCNTCRCSADGTKKACTEMFCHPDLWNSDGTLKIKPKVLRTVVEEPKRQICEPGKPFKEMCNHCACSDDGTMKACTKMMCDPEVWNEDGSLKTQTVSVEAPKKICEPMTTFKDFCNICTCSNDGTMKACTKMFCHPDIWNADGTLKKTPKVLRTAVEEPKKQICEPGKPFREMCNYCGCSDDGTMKACTKMMCDPALWNEDGSLKIQTKSLKAPKQICEPRTNFKNYCNRCTCSDDGTMAACTRMMCPPGIWNKDGSLVKPWLAVNINEIQKSGPLYKQGDACEPGESFYSLCNHCVCRADGKSAYCTLKMCY